MNDNTPSHYGNLHSFAESFYCPLMNHNDAPPPSQQQQQQQQPRKKAKRRRKRHAPPGPAGVWFQSQLVSNNNNNNHNHHNHHHNTHDSSLASRHEETVAAVAAAAPDVSSCLAWMCMQFSLQLCTPYLPRHYSVQQRFQHLRACIPRDYMLLPEILKPSSPLVYYSHQDEKLVVLVHHAAAVPYHSYWTVELRDECGASIKAWMDPLLEETEIVGRMLQTGAVWLLQHFVVLVDDDDDDDSSQQKWLLLSKSCIQRVWTPQEASNEFSDQQYIEWMTKRSLLNSNETLPATSSNNKERTVEQQEDEEEREVIDVEQEENEVAIVPRTYATSRGVVTPRLLVATSSSSSDAHQRQSANANVVNSSSSSSSSNNRATAKLLQGVSDMPRVATSGDARRVSMSQQPRASIGGGVTNPPSVAAATQGVLSQSASHSTRQSSPLPPSVPTPHANKARNTQQQGEISTASSLSVNQTITVRQTTTTTTSALTARKQLQPESCTLSQSLALPNKNDTYESSSKSPPPSIDFSQFRSPTAKSNTIWALTTNTQPAGTAAAAASMTNNPTKSKESMTESQFGNDTPESSPLQAKSTAFSKSPRPSPHCQSQSSFLRQFAAGSSPTEVESAGSSPTEVESPNLSQDSPENTQKSPPPNKTLTKRSQQQRTPVSKSAKEPSNLWRGADACILEMLDDDDDDGDENQINSLPKSSFLTRQEETTVTKETPNKETMQQESSTLAVDQQASSSLFQAWAFAGMDVDNLFDE